MYVIYGLLVVRVFPITTKSFIALLWHTFLIFTIYYTSINQSGIFHLYNYNTIQCKVSPCTKSHCKFKDLKIHESGLQLAASKKLLYSKLFVIVALKKWKDWKKNPRNFPKNLKKNPDHDQIWTNFFTRK